MLETCEGMAAALSPTPLPFAFRCRAAALSANSGGSAAQCDVALAGFKRVEVDRSTVVVLVALELIPVSLHTVSSLPDIDKAHFGLWPSL